MIISYEFTNYEDISDYIKGTTDRVSRATNRDYALLCELETFYSDRIKEVNRKLIESAWENPAIKNLMPEYFKKLGQEKIATQQEERKNRLQVDKLGISKGFIEQAGRVLEKRFGKKFSSDEISKIIRRYESITDGLTEKSSISTNKETKAFYGQLRSQREKTFVALKAITGEEINSKETHLGEVDLQQMLEMETNIEEGKYDEEQFATYTVQRFIDLFEDEKTKISNELDKFESLSGKKREVIYGYITKSKESANARMVGGVCVAKDNPSISPGKNIWEMPNYFQMVFQEPDTLQCQGLVLMHHFDEGGKKILAVSINPSSTYLYSIDETALFNGITTNLEQFASENDFDMIVSSRNHTIRTNRTGGEFEKAFDKKVKEMDKKFNFDKPKQFSHNPFYQIQEMDVLWKKDMAQK